MYKASIQFIKSVKKVDIKDKPYYTYLKETNKTIYDKKVTAYKGNSELIEMRELSKGQGGYNYSIDNVSMEENTYLFFASLSDKQIPKGYYTLGKEKARIDLTEELLKKSLDGSLGYLDLFRYTSIALRQDKITFNLKNTVRYIVRFIETMKGGSNMSVLEKIGKSAWSNGNDIAKNMLIKGKNENVIKGKALSLNSCISNRDLQGFSSIYLQLVSSNDGSFSFGRNEEYNNIDNFIQFGMNFISGLMSVVNNKKESE
jgi:hypothetical protein